MTSRSVPYTRNELAGVLADALSRVLAGDSFEGSIEYMMPGRPLVDHAFDDGDVGAFHCVHPIDPHDTSLACLMPREDHEGDPEKTASGAETEFMVRASYRVGNLHGQGGMRLVGDWS